MRPLTRRLMKTCLLALVGWNCHAAELTAAQAQEDVAVLTRALQTLHPALTKYRTPAEMDAAFARFTAHGQAARSPTDMYLAATELAAAIRCGHTWTNLLNQSDATRAALKDGADKLPVTVTWVEDRWLVLGSMVDTVKAGDAIVTINATPAPALVQRLMPYLRADGSSDGKRLRQLGHDRSDVSQMDILLPLLFPPVNGLYQLGVERNGKRLDITVPVTTLAAREAALRAQGVKPVDEQWRLVVEGDTAYLRLPTFSFWRTAFDWAGFLEQTFAQLEAQHIPYLVIDIRDNEGGDGAIGNKLLSFLIRQPLGYYPSQSVTRYERVPDDLQRFLDTWDKSFYDRTGDVELITEGTAKGMLQLKSKPYAQRFIAPAPRVYAGTTYLLIGPENSSATFSLADLAQRSKAAILVGQPTGGNRRGLNGGQLAWVTLPHSGVAVDIPLLAARYDATTPDASVTPDVAVRPDFAARAAGVDVDMRAVKGLIGQRRKAMPTKP